MTGAYYIGVSSYDNTAYSPLEAGSAAGGAYEGPYRLVVSRYDGTPTRGSVIDGKVMEFLVAEDLLARSPAFGPNSKVADAQRNAQVAADKLTVQVTQPLDMAVGVLFTNLNDQTTQRLRTTQTGNFTAVVAPNSDWEIAVYAPQSGAVATSNYSFGPSGLRTRLSPIVLGTVPQPASGQERSAEAERILGRGFDDPLEFSGAIAGLQLGGPAEALTLTTDFGFVASGSAGLEIVDIRNINNPILLGQVVLPGNAVSVAADDRSQLAFVATDDALQIVSYADPLMPSLTRTLTEPAQSVIAFDGLVVFAGNNSFAIADPGSGQVLARLTLPGSGRVKLAREGTRVYAFNIGSDVLSVIDVADPEEPQLLASRQFNIFNNNRVGLFATANTVWIAGGGLVSIDVSDPASPVLISDRDQLFRSRSVALNGTDLALVASDNDNVLRIFDVTDPTNTNHFVGEFPVSGVARDVAIVRGVALVAAGNRIEVVNYRIPDTNRVPPSVTLESLSTDRDGTKPGVQIISGSSLYLRADATDDVQIRQVDFLINDVVVSTDASFLSRPR
jgi:hypothetical protein